MLKEKRVLIIDDNENNIFALSAVMKSKGYEVLSALDASSGIEILQANLKIDVVLLDMMMPVIDGYKTIELIQSDKSISKVPIIALTANAMIGDREKCLAAGATDYCPKPVEIDELIEKINNCLK